MFPNIPYDNILIIIPASNTPSDIAINAFFLFKWSNTASNVPVQAPVPGSGIPTNSKSPKYPYLFICSLLDKVFFSNLVTIFFVWFHFFSNSNIFSINNSIKGTGKIFPIKHIIKAFINSTSNILAAINPPLN